MNDEVIKILKQISDEIAEIKQMLAERPATAVPAVSAASAQSRTLSFSGEDKVYNFEIYDGTLREWKNGANAGKGAFVRVKLLEPYEGLNWGSLAVHYVDGNPPFCVQQAGNKVSMRGRISVREYNGRQDLTLSPARNSFGNDDIWETAESQEQTTEESSEAVPAKSVPAKKSAPAKDFEDDDVPF